VWQPPHYLELLNWGLQPMLLNSNIWLPKHKDPFYKELENGLYFESVTNTSTVKLMNTPLEIWNSIGLSSDYKVVLSLAQTCSDLHCLFTQDTFWQAFTENWLLKKKESPDSLVSFGNDQLIADYAKRLQEDIKPEKFTGIGMFFAVALLFGEIYPGLEHYLSGRLCFELAINWKRWQTAEYFAKHIQQIQGPARLCRRLLTYYEKNIDTWPLLVKCLQQHPIRQRSCDLIAKLYPGKVYILLTGNQDLHRDSRQRLFLAWQGLDMNKIKVGKTKVFILLFVVVLSVLISWRSLFFL
jgi:hypothetical protein